MAEEARLRTILDSMVEAVFVTDGDGTIVLSNLALSKLTPGPAEGRRSSDLIASTDLDAAVHDALAGEARLVTFETRIGVESRAFSAQTAPLPGGGGAVVLLHDVTDLKRADTVRRDFVANASHELRTPLTAIRGFAETLRDGAIDDPVTARRFLGRILEHTQRLQRLVEDLLLLSRAESPDVGFESRPIDVRAATAKVIRGLETRAQEKGITLASEGMDEEPEVLADERALDQVLVNLVDNAVKYTPPGGSVTLRAIVEDPEHVVLEVIDTGPGIAPQQLARIFERFYRLDSGRARDEGGTGLGLAIVKHLVQRMKGEVSAASVLGEGTKFRVRLPRVQEVG